MDNDLFQQYNSVLTNIITKKNPAVNRVVLDDLIARKTAESLKQIGIQSDKYQHYERLCTNDQNKRS